jgi:hypothetical protein
MFEVKTGDVPRGRMKTPWGVALLFCLFGIIFGGIGVGTSIPCIRASGWPTAPGKVLDSSIQVSNSRKGNKTRACIVKYEFVVDAKVYTGDKLDPFIVYTSGNGAYDDQAKFPPGAACTVHYNPEYPAQSCIRTELGVLQYVFLGVGGLMLAIAIGVGFTSWWQRGMPGA